MLRTLKYVGVGLITVAFFVTCQLLAILNGWPRDEYAFLKPGTRVKASLLPENSASAGVKEYRVYSWPADFQSVRDAAITELVERGYKLELLPGPSAVMSDENGKSVLILDEKANAGTNVFDSEYEHTPGWVTVIFMNPAPVNWATPIRLAFAERV